MKNLVTDSRGAVAVVTALLLATVIIFLIAGALDVGKMQTGYVDNQNASDSAALATADWILRMKISQIATNPTGWRNTPIDSEEITKYAKQVYLQNTSDQNILALGTAPEDFQVTFVNNILTMKVCAEVLPRSLNTSVGLEGDGKMCTISRAGFGAGAESNLEIAVSLDYTASMTTNRMTRARDAIFALADRYLSSSRADGRKFYMSFAPVTTFVSMNPFHVNMVEDATLAVETHASDWEKDVIDEIPALTYENFNINNISSPQKLDGTVGNFMKFKRLYDGTGTGTPKITNPHYFTYSRAATDDNYRLLRTVIKNVRVMRQFNIQPLTDNKDVIKTMAQEIMDNYSKGDPKHYVPGHSQALSGILGAWLTIAPGWKGQWDMDSLMESGLNATRPDRANLPSVDQNVKKVLIYIGDGEDTDHARRRNNFMIDEDYDATERREMYTELCKRIGQNDIKLYFILYGHSTNKNADACKKGDPERHVVLPNITPEKLPDVLTEIVESNSKDDFKVKLLK